jgi:hypothetical protein
MHGLRRSFTALAPRAARLNKPNVVGVLSRNMVTLEQKELGEEAAYFRKQEHDLAAARKAKMDAILAREDSDHHKQALLNLVGEEKVVNTREVGILQYLGLDDWKVALPVAMCFAPPLIHHSVIIVDYKFYLVGAFCVMWHAYDAVIMPIWAEKTDWIQEDITNFWKKVDAQAIEEIDSSIKSNEDFVESKELFQDMFNAVDAISQTRAVALNKSNQNNLHRSVQKKLDALVSLNEATNAAIRTDMIDSVKAEVYKNLQSSSVKDSAMAQAIANLAAGASSPRGKDVVGEEYAKAIANYKAGLSSKDHRVHNITAKLESEIAEICKPIQVPSTAGNVYETHPVL